MASGALRYEGAGERRRWILSTLRTVGFLSITELTRQLGVSHMTIRRDLRLLEDAGLVRTVRGGVSLPQAVLCGPAFPSVKNVEGRRRIAAHAATLIDDSDTIAIDAGATGYELARAIPHTFSGTVITHSLPVLQLLADRLNPARLVALGGELAPASRAFTGRMTIYAVTQLRVRTLFLSVAALDERGMYAQTTGEASVQRALIGISDQVVLISDYAAFGGSAPVFLGPLKEFAVVVTDQPPPDGIASALVRAQIKLMVADEFG